MHELITQFGIDWKLLIAQVVNFFILLFLLKKFAYGPLLKVLRDRKDKISEGIKASEESVLALQNAEEIKNKIIRKADKDALEIVGKASKTGELESKRIVDFAHQKSEQIIISGQRKLAEDKTKLEQEVSENAQELILKALVKVTGKMNADERDSLLVSEALKELRIISKA